MPDFGSFRGFGEKLAQGQTPSQLGLIGSLNITPSFLDLYPNAAAAYSVRKLRTAYTGSAIRVRRSSDNTESDIGFTALGDLDTTALASFCGSDNGFVTTWYDQSGNAKNATKTTASLQPKIYNSGTGVITKNGKPAIEGDGTNGKHLNTTNISLLDDLCIIAVSSFNTFGNDSMLFGGTYTIYNNYFWRSDATTITWTNDNENGFGNFTVSLLTVNNLLFANRQSTNVSLSLNGTNTTKTEANTQGQPMTITTIGGAYIDSFSLAGTYQEMIFYDLNQSNNRLNIESNINSYYGIY